MDRPAKRARSAKRQLGQFLTPPIVAAELVRQTSLHEARTTLEPSFGTGAFLLPLIQHFIDQDSNGSTSAKLGRVLTERVWGVEIDPALYEAALANIRRQWGALPSEHNLVLGDYFRFEPAFDRFDLIVGNPPFGGTFDLEIEDSLDRRFGSYDGDKIKKETYCFFIAKALEELSPGGKLLFLCSDTFLTIKTMKGLRRLLLDRGRCNVDRLKAFSDETGQPIVVLTVERGAPSRAAEVFGTTVSRSAMELTGNFSWTISDSFARYFDGPTVGDFMVATGGMTIGRNELFVRKIVGDTIIEPYDFEFFESPITLEDERQKARLHQLSARVETRLVEAERRGETRRNVRVVERSQPLAVRLPNEDYRPYNKATRGRLFAPPSHVVYWRDDGDAVLTFKKNGRWYLHGVGGAPYFGREGLTWQLVAPRINARYLPSGYVLDSGAPCGFLRPGVDGSELYLILGWLQTDLATTLLKAVINHTRNIQGKDIERLPYPHWVTSDVRSEIVTMVEDSVAELMAGRAIDDVAIAAQLNQRFDRELAAEDSSTLAA